MRTVTIEESESTSEAGEALERVGLIQSRVVFVLQAKIYEYKIYPGTYQVQHRPDFSGDAEGDG